MEFEILETTRLYLRKLTGAQYQEILERCSDLEVMDFLNVARADLEKERQKAEKGFETHNKSMLLFHLIDKDSGRIIGACGYHTWYVDHARAEIGYGLYDDAFKRKGLMTEALEVVIRYGFEQMQLNRIEALAGTGNEASLRSLAKFGFVQEGLLRRHYLRNGVFEDSLVFGLLRD